MILHLDLGDFFWSALYIPLEIGVIGEIFLSNSNWRSATVIELQKEKQIEFKYNTVLLQFHFDFRNCHGDVHK